MRYMLETSNLPKNQQKIHKLNVPSCDLEAYEKLRTIQLNIKQFVNEGTNLYIWSSQVGNGKTTWATKLLLQYFDSVWETCGYTKKGIFVNAPSYLANMKASISNPEINIAEIQSSLLKVPLAVMKLWQINYLTMIIPTYIHSLILVHLKVSPQYLQEIIHQMN